MAGCLKASENLQAENLPSASIHLNGQAPKLPSPGNVLLKLLAHSIAMFTLPFFSYYIVKDFVEKEFGIEHPKNYIFGAVSSIIMVQIVIFSYVYQAFKEEQIAKKVKAASKRE
ncbi:uncharacterized protein [Procambarus clarkii]|uniref:uncharacterized protein n=1 Tax=Procambarus clarkii TaxID=6728 RepID=UPI003742D63A